MQPTNHSDVVVIGGGPAGTTAATLLKRRGYSVTLFERERHPRFHIGESLLPKNLPILEELGVIDKVREIGVFKPGADFSPPGESVDYQSFAFGRALGNSPSHAYQVKRSEFDHLLFENCASSGVNALEEHCVTKVNLDQDGRHTIRVKGFDGVITDWTCGYLIDASGRDTMLASQEKWKARNPRHASAAMFTHFKGAVFRSGDDTGNISVYWFEGGWIWMIPLRDEVMSVGIVCRPEYLQKRKVSQDEFLQQTLQKCPGAWGRLKKASQLMPVRATGNYTYSSNRHLGKGFALIGDAYAFVDPVFSSGVYLAMSSGSSVVEVAERWLRGDRPGYEKAANKYHNRVGRGISTFSWFIYRFTTPGMVALFRKPRNLFRIEQAVISMLAGDVYETPQVRLRLRIFKLIYAISQLWNGGRKRVSQP